MSVNFNKEQKQAIEFYKGACGVIAGAGSGKSTVLLNRIKHLIETHNVKEEDILAITFTDNTYKELRNLNNE
jgi:DNA helicase-2/ATP-dependent DNA helicase PcrA